MRPEEEKKASAPPPQQPAAQPAATSSVTSAAGLWRGDPPAAPALWQSPDDSGFWSQAGQAYLRTISSLPAAPWSSRKAKGTKVETPAPPSQALPPREERPLVRSPPTALYESSPPTVTAQPKPAQPAEPPVVQPVQQQGAGIAAEPLGTVSAPAEKQPAPEPIDDPAEDSDGVLQKGLPIHEQLHPVHHHTGKGADDILSRLEHITAKLSKLHHGSSFVHVDETPPVPLDPLPVVVVPEVKPRQAMVPEPAEAEPAPELSHHNLWDAHAFPALPTHPPTPFPILPEVA